MATRDLSLQHLDSLVTALRLSCLVACEISAPQPGIEPVSPAKGILNPGSMGEGPASPFNPTDYLRGEELHPVLLRMSDTSPRDKEKNSL